MITRTISRACYSLWLITGLCISTLSAQPWSSHETPQETLKQRQIGVLFGKSAGGTLVTENMKYHPILLMLHASFPLKPSATTNSRFYVVTEPQFNFFHNEEEIKHFEAGVNLGLQYRWYFNDFSWLFAQIGTGPHYISLDSPRQAGGFIFSDNMAVGISIKMVNALRTEVQYRFRHLSNASLKRPNAGINNHFIMMGLALDW